MILAGNIFPQKAAFLTPMRSITYQGITWRDYPGPTEQELRELQSAYHVHDLDIEDCLSENERPKIEEYENYLFLVFHIPYMKTERIVKEEVNIFLGSDFIVTIHGGNIPLFDRLFDEIQEFQEKKTEYLQEGTGYFLYEVMRQLFDQGFPLVDSIKKKLRIIEEELFERGGDGRAQGYPRGKTQHHHHAQRHPAAANARRGPGAQEQEVHHARSWHLL